MNPPCEAVVHTQPRSYSKLKDLGELDVTVGPDEFTTIAQEKDEDIVERSEGKSFEITISSSQRQLAIGDE